MSYDFEQASKILEKLGVKFATEEDWRPKEPPRSPHPLPLFRKIHLPFSPEEWCNLAMSEGRDYVGGCCGSSSAMQDIINHVFRFESGWIDAKDLADLMNLQFQHNNEGDEVRNSDDLGDLKLIVKNWKKLSSWQKIAVIWYLIKDCYVPDMPAPREVNEVKDAIHISQRCLEFMDFHEFFHHDNAPESQTRAGKLMNLYRLIPALKTVWEKVGELKPPPLDEAFAMVSKERSGEILSNGFGLCVFTTRDEAEKLLELWRKDQALREDKRDDEKPIDEVIGIRRVRISVEKGLEFLD